MREEVLEYEVSAQFTNSRDTNIYFVLEPLAWAYEIECQSTFTLTLRSPLQGRVEIMVGTYDGMDGLTVWDWEGCREALYRDGELLPPGAFQGPPIPQYPWPTGMLYKASELYEAVILFRNERGRTINLVLEPWESRHEVLPDTAFTLLLRSPTSAQGAVKIEDGADGVVVTAWDGCTEAALYSSGEHYTDPVFWYVV